MSSAAIDSSAWPGRFALAAAVLLLPLFIFGGTVTTIGAGMAVDGWWNAEGHFMPLFPIEKWFRDLATFVEHSHRLFGMAVGLAMLAATVATFRYDKRRSSRLLVVVGTLAVCVQGWLGGSRVLEDSPQLAFLHGAFAQAVFALLVALAVHQSRRWRNADTEGMADTRGVAAAPRLAALRRAGLVASAVVYVQIVIGAWYRHGLRNGLGENIAAALTLHLMTAFLVALVLFWLASKLAAAAEGQGVLEALRRRVLYLLAFQVALGFVAWGAQDPSRVSFVEWLVATLHVLGGALILAHCVLATLWAQRLGTARESATLPHPGLEGAA
jgi:cytochrome c oxidase assembly protein subunit 15